jgi:nucleoporin NUP82
MSSHDEWAILLDGHPIFSLPAKVAAEDELELSRDTIPAFSTSELDDDVEVGQSSLAGRKQTMCMKDSDIIVACGSEIRMTSLNDAKVSGGSKRNYKVRRHYLL